MVSPRGGIGRKMKGGDRAAEQEQNVEQRETDGGLPTGWLFGNLLLHVMCEGEESFTRPLVRRGGAGTGGQREES